MAARNSATMESDERVLFITRVFDAPRDLVWKAWTEPERMAQWTGPRGFTLTSCEMDARPGGAYRLSMRSPEGTDHRVSGVYHEIVAPERLVYTWAWVDAQGNPGHETLLTITFADHGAEKTLLTLRQSGFESVTARDGHQGGWNSAFDCLAEYLANSTGLTATQSPITAMMSHSASTQAPEREFVITRVFDAPRALVFKAWTDPKHLARWWGPKGFTNPVCELDARPGGAIRIVMRGPDGTDYPMTGVFQEIVEPERLVFVSEALDAEGKPLFEVLNTVTFSEQGGKTTLRLKARVTKSTAEAPRYLDGMEAGWTQSLERLSEYLATA